MAKVKEYRIDQVDEVCNLGKALSSPVRLEILQLLYRDSMIIGEIAKKLNLPASSTAFHLKILEQAGLIRMEEQPGTRGSTKLCNRKLDVLTIYTTKRNMDVKEVFSAEMPIGSYSSCEVSPTCGLYGPDGSVEMMTGNTPFIYRNESKPVSYGLHPDMWNINLPMVFRMDAMWTDCRFPWNCVPKHRDTGKTGNRILLCGLMEWIAERGPVREILGQDVEDSCRQTGR